MMKAFKYELNPNDEQRTMLHKHFGCARFIFNWGLNEKAKTYKESGKNISCFDLIKQVTQMKKQDEFSWLKEVHSQPLQMALRNLDNAYTNFFKGKSQFPNFKKKHRNQSFQYPQGVKLDGNKIFLPKIGWLHFYKHRDCFGKIKTVTVSMRPTGRYFVSVLCDRGLTKPEKAPIEKTATVGIDLGIKVFGYTSDNEIFENQKCLINSLKDLRREQRSLSRKEKGSNHRNKQRLVVAKLHEKVTNQRNDFLHKTSTYLVQKYDTMILEDLGVSNMIKNPKLAKHIADMGWHSFRSMVEYKAEWCGKNVIVINRFAPSSKMCNHCGHINKDLKLSHRKWTCQNCQTTVERDYNAAKNIKDFGLGNKPSAS